MKSKCICSGNLSQLHCSLTAVRLRRSKEHQAAGKASMPVHACIVVCIFALIRGGLEAAHGEKENRERT